MLSVAALLRPIFNADDREAARELVGDALDRLAKPLPKVGAVEQAEDDLLAFYGFPADHWTSAFGTRARAMLPKPTRPSTWPGMRGKPRPSSRSHRPALVAVLNVTTRRAQARSSAIAWSDTS